MNQAKRYSPEVVTGAGKSPLIGFLFPKLLTFLLSRQ